MSAIKWLIGSVAAIGGIALIASSRNRNEIDTAKGPPNSSIPPPIKTVESEASKVYYSTDSGEGGGAVKERMKQLFLFKDSRNAILQQYGVLDNLFQGVKYRAGVSAVINSLFGNVFNIPLYPSSLYPQYKAQLQAIIDEQDFETISRGGGMQAAKDRWMQVLNLPDGQSFWLPDLMSVLKTGAFGSHGKADKDWSERYTAYTDDMQAMSKNLLIDSRKLDDALRAQAIEDLRGSGWNFTGLD